MSKLFITAVAALTLSIVPAVAMQVLIDTPSGYPEDNHSHSTVSCDGDLGFLKRVYPAQIAGIGEGTKVWVTELCDGFEGLRADGNANYLRPTIAQNAVLVGALGSKAYRPEDVFAVQMMGDGVINLYVHHFGR